MKRPSHLERVMDISKMKETITARRIIEEGVSYLDSGFCGPISQSMMSKKAATRISGSELRRRLWR